MNEQNNQGPGTLPGLISILEMCKMMTGSELFQKYMEQSPDHLPQFLKSLSWEDVQVMSGEMAKRAQEARAAGDTDAVIELVTRSIPFLEYFESK